MCLDGGEIVWREGDGVSGWRQRREGCMWRERW